METKDILDALDSVTWYNSLAEDILGWKELPKDDYSIACPVIKDPQIQVIWMICCSLFGDYGTSPRSGWIYSENAEDFYAFIDAITSTYQAARSEGAER